MATGRYSKAKTARTAKTTKDTKKIPAAETAEGTEKRRAAGGTQARSVSSEAICILVLVISVLVVLGLAADMGGFGFVVRFVLFGLFGAGAFALPVIAFIGSFAVLFGKARRVSGKKAALSFALFLVFPVLIHILVGSEDGHNILGRAIGGLLVGVFNNTIAPVILVVGIGIVLAILVTGKSLFGFIMAVIEQARERNAERKARDLEEYDYEDYEEYEDRRDVFEADKKADIIPISGARHPKHVKQLKPLEPRNNAANVQPKKVFDFEVKGGDEGGTAKIIPLRGNAENNLTAEHTEKTEETETVPWDDEPPADAEITVKGVGVEGYVHKTVEVEVVEDDAENSPDVLTIIEPPSPAPFSEAGSPARPQEVREEYVYPPIELLKENPYVPSLSSRAFILENSRKLEETLKSFGVEAKVVEVCKGPTVTRYELSPGVGVKVSKISGLADDLALNLAAVGIRIEAPVPGKSVVGIEIPNKETQAVYLRDVIDDELFWAHPSKLSFAIGKDIAGNTVIADIAKMPHLLIAGATGAGKSVCINTLVASIIYKSSPEEVKLIMIDPKVVELSVYNGIPHLLIPVVTDPKKASGALNWAVREMDLRYNLFAETMTRDLKGYNDTLIARGELALPQIVIIIDELADLMMTCGKEVEESICRLAQKARAAGIHLIIATQRPSVDVITGLIKANVPSRLAFAVSSGTDSRTILDMVGAEKLLGKGDMLFSPVGLSKPQRIQGSFVSDKEVENLVNFIKRDGEVEYDDEMVEEITSSTKEDDGEMPEGDDEFTNAAIDFVVSKEKASVSMLQRRFRIGYNRAARLMEELEQKGVVGPEDGSKPRKVLMTYYQWQERKTD